jgi:hypothetical protein
MSSLSRMQMRPPPTSHSQGRPLEDTSYFNKALRQCGLVLYSDGGGSAAATSPACRHQLDEGVDPQEVAKRLTKVFQTDLSHPAKVRSFLAGAKTFLDDEANLLRSLSPTAGAADDSGGLRDSLVRVLFRVDDLQTDLLSWLLEKLVLVAMAADEETQGMSKTQLILSQLRWLDRVVDGEALADKMVEIVQASPDGLQQEVIVALPEIVGEAHHSKLAMVLRDLMKDNKDLTNAVLHAFTYLSIGGDVMEEVRRSILKTVLTLPTEILPVVVQFIMEGIEKG